MSDRKTTAILLGAIVGVAAVGITAAIYMSHHHEIVAPDINDIVDRARETVRKLDEAVDMLRQNAA